VGIELEGSIPESPGGAANWQRSGGRRTKIKVTSRRDHCSEWETNLSISSFDRSTGGIGNLDQISC
jgi:hypothetical protein